VRVNFLVELIIALGDEFFKDGGSVLGLDGGLAHLGSHVLGNVLIDL
jgi:hypothetical protein